MTDNNGMYMPVAPAGYGNDMFGGNSAWWIIILLIFGGWGNGWGGNGNVNADLQRGFDQAALTNGLTNVQTSLCNGFAGINNAISTGFAQAEVGANARQMADMNQNFALQTSVGDLKYAVATEACADRNAIAMALRDVLEAQNAGFQRIADQMCQDKIDAKNETIALLRQQVESLQNENGRNAQTATILSNLAPVAKPAYIVANPTGCNCGYTATCGN